VHHSRLRNPERLRKANKVNEEPKPKLTIDERIELLTRNIQQMHADEQRRDRRERKAREAMLAGIAAYFRALNDDEEEETA